MCQRGEDSLYFNFVRMLGVLLLALLLANCAPEKKKTPKAAADPVVGGAPPAATYRVSGRILNFSHGQIQLSLSGSEQITLSSAGDFAFLSELDSGESYLVSILSQPSAPAITCTVNNSSGIALGNIVNVEVICPTLSTLSVSTPQNSIARERRMQASAAGVFSDGSVRNMTSFVTWISDGTSVLSASSTGEVTGISAGSASLRAEFGQTSASRQIQVTNATLQSLSLSPQQIIMGQSAQIPMQAIGLFSDGTQINLTSEVSWASSNAAVASLAGALLSSRAPGSSMISASLGGLSSSTPVTVTNATLQSLQISPVIVRSQVGSYVQLYATGLYSDNTFRDVSSLVSWSSADNAAVAFSSTGLAHVQQVGITLVTAQLQGFLALAQVIGENKSLQSIVIESPSSTLPVNQSIRLKAFGQFSDGSEQDLTSTVSWSSTSPSIAEVSILDPNKGLVTGLSSGATNIQAQFGTVMAQTQITVNAATLASLQIIPSSTLISRQTNLNYRAQGTFSDGSVLDITGLVTWSSSNSAQVIMTNGGDQAGLMTNLYNGTAYPAVTITASLSGQSATSLLTITPATLTAIQINPSAATINSLSSRPLRAYGIFNDGAAIDLTSVVTWKTDDANLLFASNSFSSSGEVTALAEGTVNARAELGALVGTSNITIDDLAAESEVSTGVGLTAAYYAGSNFETLRGTRIDSTVNYSWGTGLAPLGVGDSFSIRWTGFLYAPTTGNYQFCTRSDDGVRLRINGVLVINNWTDHAEVENCSGQISLAAGSLNTVLLEFYERGGFATIRLNWVRPGFPLQNIAKEFLYPR